MSIQNEASNTYSYTVGLDMLDGNGIMKPGGYQKIICDVIETHLDRIHLSVNDLSKYNMWWVLVSSSFEVITPIKPEMSLIGRTWHSSMDKATFRRELTFTDLEGSPVFNAVTFSVLLDRSTRRIVAPDNLEFDIGEPFPQFAMEGSSRFRNRCEMHNCDSRRIYPSYIDRLGHTNNCRYSEFAYDALTVNEIDNLAALRRMDLYFMSELRLGDTFTVRRNISEVSTGELIIDGVNDRNGKRSFACKMIFA